MAETDIHPTAVIGLPFRYLQGGRIPDIDYEETSIGQNVHIGPGVIVGKGARIGDNCVLDAQCIVEPNAVLGSGTLLIYRAIIGGEAVIGSDCVIGGLIAERCVIGNGCRIFGQLVHSQHDTTASWDDSPPEPSTSVGDMTFVGFGAVIAGGLKLGTCSYICANATVTRDVPDRHIASGVNLIVPAAKWSGRLSTNPIFSGLK